MPNHGKLEANNFTRNEHLIVNFIAGSGAMGESG
jgi:hypothetical protein